MSVTIRQIAEAAKVSRGTVDKVLNNRPGVSVEVREQILQLANELGYKPNAAGKSLAFQKKPLRIGFLLPTAHDPFYLDVQAGIARAADELAGFGVEVVCRTMEHITVADQLACIRAMAQSSLAGPGRSAASRSLAGSASPVLPAVTLVAVMTSLSGSIATCPL